jgi:hypothetical protein
MALSGREARPRPLVVQPESHRLRPGDAGPSAIRRKVVLAVERSFTVA